MKNDAIGKFLLGTADDNEQRQCEELLANPETVVDCQSTVSDDSLLTALRSDGSADVNSGTIRQLAEKIEQLVPRHAFSAEELQRLLDPAILPDDLGRIGRYRVIEFLASGGMGLVFRAIDPDLNREVCIKLLNPNHGLNAEAISRFDREARSAARMTCERIMPVLEIGRQNGLPFLVMPMLEGMSLRSLLARERKIPPERAIRLARQIAEGLEYAHERGVLHRDIKPDNLWVTPTGDIKLLDFGLARTTDDLAPITKAGTVLGTPSYMSPEQVTGKPLDGRSDLFSLGVVLVEMLTGQSPFQKTNLFSTLMSVAGDEIEFGSLDEGGEIPPGLREVVHRLLKKSASERVGSASELIGILGRVQATLQPALTRPVSESGNRWWKTVAAVLAGFAVCLAGLAIWNATNKGTLVVETADPSVEIKIANERVSIHDPVTDRKYEIRIGETPLPSGVYQLETTDSTGELVFSSQTITIRRGEKAIVTVELRHAESLAANSGADPVENVPAAEIIGDNLTWADKSHDPVARDRFGEMLPTLQAIEILDPENDEWSIHSDSTMAKQRVGLPGLSAWSIEPAVRRTDYQKANCDRSLFARYDYRSNFVCVVDAKNQAKYYLPFRKSVVQSMEFDNRHPRLLATCSAAANAWGMKAGELPPNPFEVTIWRLDDGFAEALYRFPASSHAIAWNDGYRIAYFKDRKLEFFRLDLGTAFEIEGTAQEENAQIGFSPGARYFTSRARVGGQYQLSIWDLQNLEFAMAIPETGSFQWKDDGSLLAVYGTREQRYGFWNIDQRSLVKQVELPPAPEQYDSPKTIVMKGLESNFHRLAWITREGELTIQNLDNNRLGSLRVGDIPAAGRTLEWQPDGRLLISDGATKILWVPIQSDVHGEFRRQTTIVGESINAIGDSDKLTALRLGSVKDIDGERIGLQWRAPRENGNEDGRRTIVGTIDLANQVVDPKVSDENWMIHDPNLWSPDRKSRLRMENNSTAGRSSGTTQVFLESVETGREIHHFGEFRFDVRRQLAPQIRMAWSDDSRFVAVSGSRQQTRIVNNQRLPVLDTQLVVFDIGNSTLIDCTALGLPERGVDFVLPWTGGFLIDYTPERQDPQSQTWILNLKDQSATRSQIFSDFGSYNPVWQKDSEIIFTGRKLEEGEPDNSSASRRNVTWYKGRIADDRLTDIQSLEVLEFDEVAFSSSGKYALRTWYPLGNISQTGTYRQFSAEGDQSISFLDWNHLDQNPEGSDLPKGGNFRIRSLQWHTSANSAAWESGGLLTFLDARTQKARTLIMSEPSFGSIQFGWLVSHEDRLVAVDPNGEYLGQMVFDEFLVDGKPANPRWILADGSMQADASREGLYMVYCRANRVWCEPLSSYIANPENPKLPTFDRVPFLGSKVAQ